MSCPACVDCGLRVAQQLHEQHMQMNQRHEEEVKELEDRESEHEAWQFLFFSIMNLQKGHNDNLNYRAED